MRRRRLHPSHNSTLIRLICIGRHKADVAFSFYLGGRRSFSFGSFKMASDGTASGPTCLSSRLGFHSFAISHCLGLVGLALFAVGPCFMWAFVAGAWDGALAPDPPDARPTEFPRR